MRERFRLREITVVADRGMVSQATLEAFEKSDPPVGYIVGVRMRRQKEVNTSVLGSRARWFESVPERSNAKDPAPLKVKEVWVKERRYIVCLNEEERFRLTNHMVGGVGPAPGFDSWLFPGEPRRRR